MPGQQREAGRDPNEACTAQHQQQQAMEIGQHHFRALLEQAVGDEAGEGQLGQPGPDQTERHQVGDGCLELGYQKRRSDQAHAEQTHQQNADDGEHPGAGADHAGIGVGLYQTEQGVLAQQAAQFKTDTGHQRASFWDARASS